MMKDAQYLALTSAIGLAIGAAVLYSIWRRKKERAKWVEVATVDKLYVHPLKSCRGISVDNFNCTETAIMINGAEIGDRCFMIIHDKGMTATIRQFPRMVLIRPSVIGRNRLRLEAPGMEPFEMAVPTLAKSKVFNYKVRADTNCPGVDCGDEAGAWLQKFLKADNVRLVFHIQGLPHRERDKLVGFDHLGVYAKPLKSVFHDYDAFNVLSQASLDFLNTKLDADHKVTERNFRPNVLVKGCEAFAEDEWKRIKIGGAEFQFAKQTTRCHVTTVNPETGIKDQQLTTLTTLSSFRLCTPEEKPLYGNSPKFCVDFVVMKEGKIRVGDKVLLYIGDKAD